MPPKPTFDQARQFGLFLIKAVLNARADELVDLAKVSYALIADEMLGWSSSDRRVVQLIKATTTITPDHSSTQIPIVTITIKSHGGTRAQPRQKVFVRRWPCVLSASIHRFISP